MEAQTNNENQNADKEANIEKLKKIRYFRNLAASVVSFALALIIALIAIGNLSLT